MLQFYVAKELGLTLNELRTRMTDTEILGWNAYLSIQADEERKAYEKAKRGRHYPGGFYRVYTGKTN